MVMLMSGFHGIGRIRHYILFIYKLCNVQEPMRMRYLVHLSFISISLLVTSKSKKGENFISDFI